MALKREQPAPAPASAAVLTRPAAGAGDSQAYEQTLRPCSFTEYVGQGKVKEHLMMHLRAAVSRKEPLGHTLLHGPPGLGKTTLALILAKEMGSQIRITSGPVLEKPGDLASILSNLQQGDLLFIDEIHRLRPVVEEMLYSAMEDFALDLVIGKGPTARSMRITLKPFTLVGATTKPGAMSAPLRDRFLHHFKLAFYTDAEMQQVVQRSAQLLKVPIVPEAAMRIARSSRATPRIANRLIRAVRDFAEVRGTPAITVEDAEHTLQSLGIDEDGLDATDRQILTSIVDTFAGGPVGLSTIAAVLAEEQGTIEDVYEPFLLQQGYLQRTPKGRTATAKAYRKLGRELPKEAQASLL